MNVLVVSVRFPFPARSGVTARVSELVNQLVRSHDVTLLSYATPEDTEAVGEARRWLEVEVVERTEEPRLAKRVAQLRSLTSPRPFSLREAESAELQRALERLCARRRFDVVQLEGSLLCGLRIPPGPRVVLDEHNIEYEVLQRMCEGERSLGRRAFNRLEQRRFRRFERAAWTRVDGCAVTSEREAPVIRTAAPGIAVEVVPNAVDVVRFSPAREAVEPRSVVFNGTLEYRPNVDAALHLVDDVWPRVRARCPDARLLIVGPAGAAEIRRLTRPGVAVTGRVPDVREYLARAAVVTVPVRIGGGTRLKVVEALAMGKAIVSTTLGCEGIDVRDGAHLLIADDPAAFAARIVELFESPAAAERLGLAGRRLVEERYTWELAGERLAALHDRVTGKAGAAADYAASAERSRSISLRIA